MTSIRLAFMLCVLAAASAAAEPVFIEASGERVGQGWLFWDSATQSCSVVTAGHVVNSGDVGHVVIVGRRDVEGSATAIKIISPQLEQGGLDIALLTVGGPLASDGCTSSVIGSTNLTYTLQRLQSGTVEFVDKTHEIVRHDVDFVANSTSHPEIMALNVHDPLDPIKKGFSGSAVLDPPADRTGPGAPPIALAMIIETTAGAATLAVRYDAIWQLVRAQLGAAKPAAVEVHDAVGNYHITWWSSGTVDPSCPATNALLVGAACPWRVRPTDASQSVQLVVAMDGADPTLSDIALEITKKGDQDLQPATTVEVSPDQTGDNWSWIGRCTAAMGGTECHFAQTNARRFRITVADQNHQELNIRISGVSR